MTPFGREIEADTIKRSFKIPEEHSDFLVIYRAYKSWRKNCENGTWTAFCRKHFMSHQNLVQVEELKCQYLSNLMDAGFISKENGTTRYPRCPRVRFARIEPDLDRNSEDGEVIMACMAAAMHPKILYLDVGGVWKTLSNNAPVAIHPSSSNFIHGRRPDFGDANFITFFNIQQSKRLCECSRAPPSCIDVVCCRVRTKTFVRILNLQTSGRTGSSLTRPSCSCAAMRMSRYGGVGVERAVSAIVRPRLTCLSALLH